MLVLLIFWTIACGRERIPIDNAAVSNNLTSLLNKAGVKPNTYQPQLNPQKAELGRLLFFDKVLSGNLDTSCATCHHPLMRTVDSLPLSLGTGNKGLGPTRTLHPGRTLIPRNSPDLFNRGHPQWTTLFWDGRVSGTLSMGFDTPADFQILEGIENILAAQALFPVTSRDEMRGNIGDVDVHGQTNVIALIADDNYTQIWEVLFNRIWQVAEYQQLLRLAYPTVNEFEFTFAHIANAIAEYEIASFTKMNSPFDRYLNGEKTALSSNAINGAKLFFGKAQCADCHTGILLTDQKYYNLGVPQLGPGKDTAAPLDFGRNLETYTEEDKFCFRTPSLRNVALTGPYMHNGAYNDLNSAVIHHLKAQEMLSTYNGEELPAVFEASVHNNIATQQNVLTTLDEHAINPPVISETEIDLLIDFLNALTDPAALDLNHTIPEQVPSGLPVFD